MSFLKAFGNRQMFSLLFAFFIVGSWLVGAYADDGGDDLEEKIVSAFESVLSALTSGLLRISRLIYSCMSLVGVLLWASGWNPRRGRDLILGAVVIAVFVEMIFPYIYPS